MCGENLSFLAEATRFTVGNHTTDFSLDGWLNGIAQFAWNESASIKMAINQFRLTAHTTHMQNTTVRMKKIPFNSLTARNSACTVITCNRCRNLLFNFDHLLRLPQNYKLFDLESCISTITLEKLCELCKHIDSWLASGREKVVILQDR